MSKLKVEIRSDAVATKEVPGKKGLLVFREQDAIISMPNGETRRISVNLDKRAPFAVGVYVLDIEKVIEVSRFGRLELNGFGVAAAMVAAK